MRLIDESTRRGNLGTEPHHPVRPAQLLCDRVLRNGRGSKVVSYANERRDGACDEILDAPQCRRHRVRVRVEQEGMVWMLGGEFARKGQDVVERCAGENVEG